jgi:hypothetical protein
MGGKIRSAISNGQLGRSISGTLAALSASAALVMMPTKQSAFDAKYEAGLAPRAAWRRPPSAMRRPIRGPGSGRAFDDQPAFKLAR